jgi:hypothetical protein
MPVFIRQWLHLYAVIKVWDIIYGKFNFKYNLSHIQTRTVFLTYIKVFLNDAVISVIFNIKIGLFDAYWHQIYFISHARDNNGFDFKLFESLRCHLNMQNISFDEIPF